MLSGGGLGLMPSFSLQEMSVALVAPSIFLRKIDPTPWSNSRPRFHCRRMETPSFTTTGESVQKFSGSNV